MPTALGFPAELAYERAHDVELVRAHAPADAGQRQVVERVAERREAADPVADQRGGPAREDGKQLGLRALGHYTV